MIKAPEQLIRAIFLEACYAADERVLSRYHWLKHQWFLQMAGVPTDWEAALPDHLNHDVADDE